MEAAAAAAGPELGRPEGPAARGDMSPGAPGESPGPEVLDAPGGAAEPGPEIPEEPEPCEPGEARLEESQLPRPEEPSEPEVTAGPPAPSVAAPAASGGGEEEASGRDGVAGQAPAAPGGAERKSGEAAGEAPEERAALLEQRAALAGERERLRQDSAELQQAERRAGGPQLYDQCLLRLQDLREQQERVAARRRGGEERQAQAQAEWAALQARKKEVAVSCLGRRLGGRRAAAKAVDGIQARERDTERQVYEVRMEKIKLKHEIQNLETILKAQGELVESQHFIDFEHKKNQKHSGNLDDLSDEILKLKKKVSNTVRIISQFREKIQFVQAENQGRKAELMDSETVLSQKRRILTGTRQARARLRKNNLKLQQKCGLLGNEMLLQDFEEKVNTVELLSQRLETLKCHHAGLLLTRRELRKKIKEANSLLAEDDWRKESTEQK